ncbi:hypothetical protein N474_24810 [Pseudoalteromonas luteoviolacea CPMOR-2]|uniref:Uncharacterized protein n=1 Tax=Pseudoalteromonas luteoviolacea DSM 6061 TaxID=1365250 RepID=A0A167D9V2_9GAMM|nr:hypothetical protein [Pseudoalteromonas luteoviolacea]KZN48588.1 hypothetical protein N475_06050 [Pseudoalteromonas luteoviolacea DSM 6061]KZN49250.1 hypothetical protein N474_24810 [Pseudoalteromonas luteoviolacea CPMOR-2]
MLRIVVNHEVCDCFKSFDGFCAENSLSSPLIDEFADHLWKWPFIDSPDQFTPWEPSKPYIVNYGIGDEANSELKFCGRASGGV